MALDTPSSMPPRSKTSYSPRFTTTLRAAHQLLITTGAASPRAAGEAQRSASSSEVRASLQNLQSFIGNRSTAASQVGANPQRSVPTATWVSRALDATAKDALGASPPHQIHWASAGQILGAPTIHGTASQDLGVWSVASQDGLAGTQIQLATQGASRVHIEQGGRKAFVSEGNAETTVSKGRLHILVEGNITLQSHNDLSFKTQGSSIKLTAGGHAGLKAAGASVMQTSLHQAKAGAVMVQGGSSAQVPEGLSAAAMNPTKNWLALKRLDDGLQPFGPCKVSAMFAGGERREGVLDKNGSVRFEDVPAGLAQVVYTDPPPPQLPSAHSVAKLQPGLAQLLKGQG